MGKQDNNIDQYLKLHKAFETDGVDVEFSMEEADQDDLEALARSEAADERAKNRKEK